MRLKYNLFSVDSSKTYFEVEHVKKDLKTLALQGSLVNYLSQIIKQILLLLSTVILARLLTPGDFGLIAMVTAVTGFISLFKDLGLSTATVQRAEINQSQVSSLFWLNLILSGAIVVLAALLSPVIAWFYREPKLQTITLVLVSSFLFSGLTAQHRALLVRQMKFKSLAVIDNISLSIGVGAGIFSAFFNMQYWALVIMTVTTSFFEMLLTGIFCPWIPHLQKGFEHIKSFLAFGGRLSGFNILNYLARNLDDLLIGKFWGAQSLGFYSKAYSLLLFPLNQINAPLSSVITPALSRLHDEPYQFRSLYLNGLSVVCTLSLPLVFLLLILSKEIILFFLGPQWLESVAVFKILAVAGILQVITNTAGWLFVSSGRVDRLFKWGMVSCPLIVLSFVIGLPYGIKGVAFCYTCAMVILFWPCIRYSTQGTSVRASDVMMAVKNPLLSSLIAAFICTFIHLITSVNLPLFPTLLVCSLTMGCVYCYVLLYLFKTKDFYVSLLKSLMQLKTKAV